VGSRRLILGFAGLVDRRKTALVKALTGIDTARVARDGPEGPSFA
jgi:translation initiation factor 2 gamma subunit (eIF-2gamma)